MAVSVVEAIGAQTSSDPGFLSATFVSTPIAGDVALVFVTFDDTVTSSSQVTMSGLGAIWRLIAEYPTGETGQWLGVYEAKGLDGSSSQLTATESYTGSITRFGLSAFLLRGAVGTSPFYIGESGYNSNPPSISLTPLAAGDLVLGMWLQSSTTAPTITTSPASGWTAGSQAVNGTSLQWSHIVAADTSVHTMDSNVAAKYVSIGVASQAGTSRVGSAYAEAPVVNTALERRVAAMNMDAVLSGDVERRLGAASADVVLASSDRRVARTHLEIMVTRRMFVGWGVPI